MENSTKRHTRKNSVETITTAVDDTAQLNKMRPESGYGSFTESDIASSGKEEFVDVQLRPKAVLRQKSKRHLEREEKIQSQEVPLPPQNTPRTSIYSNPGFKIDYPEIETEEMVGDSKIKMRFLDFICPCMPKRGKTDLEVLLAMQK